jgi:hypothetical protein
VRKGDLVRVTWGGTANPQTALGVVLDYRPDVLGGSSSQSYWDGRQRVNEFISSPKRGQVLVTTYEDGAAAWWDEKNVELLTDG